MSDLVQFPGAGCVIEYLMGNEPHIAWVMEEQKGRLRLLHENRKEASLAASRLLPWSGPAYGAARSREEITGILAGHRERRAALAAQVDAVGLWEMAQGEMRSASAAWFAELLEDAPDADAVAACGRALLACKSHFKFQPPLFEIYDAQTVEVRRAAEEAARQREALVAGGAAWLRTLCDAARGRRPRPDPADAPADPVGERLRHMILTRITDPESTDEEGLWKQVSKGLPDDPFLPLLLAQAWGLVPAHYDLWLDRAGFESGTAWEGRHAGECAAIADAVGSGSMPPLSAVQFISIDSPATRDIDDAFHIEGARGGGWDVTVALACPALFWDFGGALDTAVAWRGTSLYLPEGVSHMMPVSLSEGAFSLFAGKRRPAVLVRLHVAEDGSAGEGDFSVGTVCLAANLDYAGCEEALDGAENRAAPYAGELRLAHAMSQARLDWRVRQGAVIIDKPELEISLEGEGEDTVVHVGEAPQAPRAMQLVSELMILANAALAQWAVARDVPLLYRTQDIAVPRESAGVWRSAADIARVVRGFAAASLDTQPRPHAGIGLPAYAPFSSPIRRYADLVNEAQLLHVMETGAPRWNAPEMEGIRSRLALRLDAMGQVQRFRPRYWKYLYMQQQSALHGGECIWKAEIAEENDSWVSVNLPEVQVVLRARKQIFGEKAHPGQEFMVRLARISPLRAEAFIAEACAV